MADLQPNLQSEDDHVLADRLAGENPIDYLDEVRIDASEIILDSLATVASGRLLDVGCASGLFLELAARRGFAVLGVEPNPVMAASAQSRGVPVATGLFPEALPAGKKFDVITFNDVIEHIGDLDTILAACHSCLEDGGRLSINVPNSRGMFFRLARILNRLGYPGPWNRLWQTMFYTPHLHYFNPDSLRRIVERNGFDALIGPIELPVIRIKGLWGRLAADKATSTLGCAIQYLFVALAYPLYAASTKDSFFIVFRKR